MTTIGTQLLQLARVAILHHLGQGPAPEPERYSALGERGASFVTVQVDGEMRGSHGSLRRTRSLGADVVFNAVAAVSADPRFSAISADELEHLRIEVAALSEPEFLEFDNEQELLQQLTPGADGLMLFACCRNASLMPQMWAQHPQPAQFLAALKEKAGLEPGHSLAAMMIARFQLQSWQEEVQPA